MSLPELFKDLKLDAWYKILVYIGGVALFFSLFLEVKGITNKQLQILSGGFFLIGLGEWKNHKKISYIKPPNVYTGLTALVTQIVRRPDIVGMLFDFIGVTLIVVFIWSLL